MRDTRSTIVPLVHRPHWSAKLTHSLTLKDGTELVTLADARACLTRYRSTGTYSPGVARGTERAIKLIMKAAETGAYPDRQAATDQVAIVLRWRAVY
jgi:hypothetical protein